MRAVTRMLLLAAVPLIATGCQKSVTVENVTVNNDMTTNAMMPADMNDMTMNDMTMDGNDSDMRTGDNTRTLGITQGSGPDK